MTWSRGAALLSCKPGFGAAPGEYQANIGGVSTAPLLEGQFTGRQLVVTVRAGADLPGGQQGNGRQDRCTPLLEVLPDCWRGPRPPEKQWLFPTRTAAVTSVKPRSNKPAATPLAFRSAEWL